MEHFVILVCLVYISLNNFTSAGCSPSEWECQNGNCISISAVCDAFPDCIDESDEKNCIGPTICSEGQKKCFHSYENFTCTNSATPCDCGFPGNIMYGTATLDDPTNSSAGASASVTCNNGYQTSAPSLTCLPTGIWTNSRCTAKDCGQLPPISAGSITLVDPKNTTYGASATVTCFTGYQANATSISCLASGLWQSASCIIIDCGQLPPISAGSITLVDPKNTTYGARAKVTCFTGYHASVTSVTCLTSGFWESASCTIIDCGQLPPISAGSITLVDPKNTTHGASATVTCFTGYQANVTPVSCLASGLWQSASCIIIDCGQLPPISSGSITLVDPKNTTYGASATVTCFTGYQANVTSISCLASGLWESARCTVIDCGQLPPISAGIIKLVDLKNTTYGASATVNCFTGYQANVTSVTCLASGLWESASCRAIDSTLPATSITQKDNNTVLIIVLVLVFGVACLIQICVATCLYVMIYRTSNSDAGKAVWFILLSAIPYIGIVFIIRLHIWSYKTFQERDTKARFNPQKSADHHERIGQRSNKNTYGKSKCVEDVKNATEDDTVAHYDYIDLEPEAENTDNTRGNQSTMAMDNSAVLNSDIELHDEGNTYQHLRPERRHSDRYTELRSANLQKGSDHYTQLRSGNLQKDSDQYTKLQTVGLQKVSDQYINLQSDDLQQGSDQYTNPQSDNLQKGSDHYINLQSDNLQKGSAQYTNL